MERVNFQAIEKKWQAKFSSSKLHNKGGKKLGRNGTHRRALMRNLATELFRHERIETTLGKAKALRPVAEKLIT